MTRVGVMGGTFDPIHFGHLIAAEEARLRFQLQRIMFVPNGSPPHKKDYEVSSAEARHDMVVLATASNPGFETSRTETERPGLQRFRRDLRERLSNSCERRADCELYQGAASGAPVDLKEADRLYAVARDKADDPAVRLAMSYKRAIVLALGRWQGTCTQNPS